MTLQRHLMQPEAGIGFASARRADWVRLRTIVYLRWIAIAGQLAAILAGATVFGLNLQIGWLLVAVGAAAVSNLVATFVFPETRRLSGRELTLLLLFDMVQLSSLLALSGGLNNPFALLIVAQVTIAATTLRLPGTVLIGAVGIALVTALALWHAPLTTRTGTDLELPDLFLFGFWAAIVIGVLFQAAYAKRVTSEAATMSDALAATQMALAREQKLTDLGGVVAAAAHELGTPLATIALVSAEMLDDVTDPDLRADAQLIRDQAERCRLILRSMGRAGKEDLHLRSAPVSSVLEEAAEPHAGRGPTILYDLSPDPGGDQRQPVILRRPEVIHGIRNLIQNAVDFAQATVWIGVRWSDASIMLRIADDGPGYPSEMLPRLGDPFLRGRRDGPESPRAGREGMGLGLFIAKTLLERTGAELAFANANANAAGGGAVVTAQWRRIDLVDPADARGPLGENRVLLN